MLAHAHSGLRWVVLILMLVAIAKAVGWKKKTEFKEGDRKIFLFAMIAFHTQFLLGFVLYFQSDLVQFVPGFMKNPVYRFYGMEHILGMVIAFVLITMGHSKSKKATDVIKKYKSIAVFYIIAMIIVLASIPWPFRDLGGQWF